MSTETRPIPERVRATFQAIKDEQATLAQRERDLLSVAVAMLDDAEGASVNFNLDTGLITITRSDAPAPIDPPASSPAPVDEPPPTSAPASDRASESDPPSPADEAETAGLAPGEAPSSEAS